MWLFSLKLLNRTLFHDCSPIFANKLLQSFPMNVILEFSLHKKSASIIEIKGNIFTLVMKNQKGSGNIFID